MSALRQPPLRETTKPGLAPRSQGVVAEVVGYIGGLLAVTSGIIVAAQFWADIRPAARVALLAVTALALAGAGASLRGPDRPEIARLGSFLWTLSVAAFAGAAAQLAGDVLALDDETTALLAAGASTGYAGLLWALRRRTLQLLALFIGVVVTAATGLAFIEQGLMTWAGLLLWALGVCWVLLAWGGVIRPQSSAYAMGAVAALLGPRMSAGHRWELLIGLATAATLVAAGVWLARPPLLGLGIFGLVLFIPFVIFSYFGDTLGAPVALFLTGVMLVAGAVLFLRLRPRGGAPL